MADEQASARTREANKLGLVLWLRIARIYGRHLRLGAEHLRSWNLTNAQFDVLAQVGSAEGLTQQELAQRLLVTQGNVTQLLDKMEQRGLIERCPEGRSKRLVLTEAGRQLYDEVVPAHEVIQAEQFEQLSRDEQRQLLVLLRKLDHAQP